jgi:hypothetical protein
MHWGSPWAPPRGQNVPLWCGGDLNLFPSCSLCTLPKIQRMEGEETWALSDWLWGQQHPRWLGGPLQATGEGSWGLNGLSTQASHQVMPFWGLASQLVCVCASLCALAPNSDVKTITLLHHYKGALTCWCKCSFLTRLRKWNGSEGNGKAPRE